MTWLHFSSNFQLQIWLLTWPSNDFYTFNGFAFDIYAGLIKYIQHTFNTLLACLNFIFACTSHSLEFFIPTCAVYGDLTFWMLECSLYLFDCTVHEIYRLWALIVQSYMLCSMEKLDRKITHLDKCSKAVPKILLFKFQGYLGHNSKKMIYFC